MQFVGLLATDIGYSNFFITRLEGFWRSQYELDFWSIELIQEQVMFYEGISL